MDVTRLTEAKQARGALASRFLQAGPIEHDDVTTAVADQASLLELACNQGHRRSWRGQHVGNEILRQWKFRVLGAAAELPAP